jgi:hypothetical protein
MDKIRRREFTGSWLWVVLLCLTGVGVPIAVIYAIQSTVEIETEVPDAEAAWEKIRRRRR